VVISAGVMLPAAQDTSTLSDEARVQSASLFMVERPASSTKQLLRVPPGIHAGAAAADLAAGLVTTLSMRFSL